MTETSSETHSLPFALDAMGGDIGPEVNVGGAVAAAREDGAKTILVGDEATIQKELERAGASDLLESGVLAVRHAPEVVAMDDKPAVAVRLAARIMPTWA